MVTTVTTDLIEEQTLIEDIEPFQIQEETESHLEEVIQTEEEILLHQEEHQIHQEIKTFVLLEE